LIELLNKYKTEFMTTADQKTYYYAKRERFNELKINGDTSVNYRKIGTVHISQ
jgi:hypothetical protein